MGMLEWSEGLVKKLSIWDFALMKTALLAFGMMVGSFVPGFVQEYLGFFLGLFVVLYAYLLIKVFRK